MTPRAIIKSNKNFALDFELHLDNYIWQRILVTIESVLNG